MVTAMNRRSFVSTTAATLAGLSTVGRNSSAAERRTYRILLRSSWQTALGAVPQMTFDDNTDEWRGDHCIAAHLVPGVFLSNRKPRYRDLRLEDLTVTLLHEYGMNVGPGMTGRAAF